MMQHNAQFCCIPNRQALCRFSAPTREPKPMPVSTPVATPARRLCRLPSLVLAPMLAIAPLGPVFAADNAITGNASVSDSAGCTGSSCGATDPTGGATPRIATGRDDALQGGTHGEDAAAAGHSDAASDEAVPEGHGGGAMGVALETGGSSGDGSDAPTSDCCDTGTGISPSLQASGDGRDGMAAAGTAGASGSGS